MASKKLSAKSITELLKEPLPTFKHGYRWGNWQLDTEHFTLDYMNPERRTQEAYSIRLAEIRTSANMLDWIFQLQAKSWTQPNDVGLLVKAFDDLFSPQSNLCSGGMDKPIEDPKVLLSTVFKNKGTR